MPARGVLHTLTASPLAANLHNDAFGDSGAAQIAAHLNNRLAPEIGTYAISFFVLCVFEESGTNVVLSELRNRGDARPLAVWRTC